MPWPLSRRGSKERATKDQSQTIPTGERFIYVTYIRSTPQKLWQALTERQFTEQFWYGLSVECDWQQGSAWRLLTLDGTAAHTGQVLEADTPRKLVLAWCHEFIPKLTAEGYTRVSFEIKQLDDMVKLTVNQEADQDGNTVRVMANGWPLLLAGLKTLIETGLALKSASHWPMKHQITLTRANDGVQ